MKGNDGDDDEVGMNVMHAGVGMCLCMGAGPTYFGGTIDGYKIEQFFTVVT